MGARHFLRPVFPSYRSSNDVVSGQCCPPFGSRLTELPLGQFSKFHDVETGNPSRVSVFGHGRMTLTDMTVAFNYGFRSQSAARSPIIIVVALVLALITFGITEASATFIFSKP